MTQRLQIHLDSKPCYEIVFCADFNLLEEELLKFRTEKRKLAIITDSNVEKLYGEEILNIARSVSQKAVLYSFEAGEESKTLDTVKNVYQFLIDNDLDRHDMLIALGGGVVGDLTGYTAATYLRGIDFIQIPTTLLAQADSSIGGKTGVDFDGYKNMVGAFHMPKLVYMNAATLLTLDGRQFASGFAEIMKHGLIKDEAFYVWLLENMYEINDRSLDILQEMVFRSSQVKREVVEKDPMELGERALLNFGHTIGHAIEKALQFELYHGECVALGCVAAAYLSWKHELLSMEEYYEIRDMFVPFGLPISVEHINAEEILALTKKDKKMISGSINFILLKKVGKALIDKTVTEEEIIAAVNEIIYKEEESA